MSSPANNDAQHATPPKTRRRRWAKALAYALSFVLTLSFSLTLLVQTERGSAWLVQTLASALPGQITLQQLSGNLAQGLGISRLDYHDPQVKLQLHQLQLEIHWRQLLRGELKLAVLRVADIQLQQLASSPQNTNVLKHIGLPIAFVIDDWQIGRLSWQSGQQAAQELLHDAHGTLSFKQQWQWQIQASSERLRWQTQGQLAADAPFKLQATAQGQLPLAELAARAETNRAALATTYLQFQSNWQGSLHELQAQLSAKVVPMPNKAGPDASSAAQADNGASSQLNLQLSLRDVLQFNRTELARHIQHIDLQLQDFNPAVWQSNWPQAHLQGSAQIAPATPNAAAKAAANLQIQVNIKNQKTLRWDQFGLPIKEVNMAGQLDLQRAELAQIRLLFAGQGQIQGQAKLAWNEHGLNLVEVNQQLSQVNLHELDKRLQTTQLRGQLQLQGGTATTPVKALELRAQLHEQQAELVAQANYHLATQKLHLSQLQLQAQQAQLEARGELQLSQEQAFALDLSMQRFDPSRWLKMPGGDLSAKLQLSGQLQKPRAQHAAAPAWQASLKNLQGQLAGASLKGSAEVRQEVGQALQIKQAQFVWGNNHLDLNAELLEHSYWPKSLRLQLQARQLNLIDQICSALNLPYRFAGEVELQGNWAATQSQWQVSARQLQMRWPGNTMDLAELQGRADLQLAQPGGTAKAAKTGIWQAQLQAKNWHWQAEQAQAWQKQLGQVQSLNLQVSGTPAQHQIQLQQRWQNQTDLSLALQASLQTTRTSTQAAGENFSWQAKLSELTLDLSKPAAQAKQTYSLSSPAQLRWAEQALTVQQFNWRGPWLGLQLEELKADAQGIRSKGKILDFAALNWANFAQKNTLLTGDLQLAADWKISWPWGKADAGSSTASQVRQAELNVQRQAGDLQIHDEEGVRLAVALGLQQWQLQARADARQLTWRSQAQGAKLGRWQAQGQVDFDQAEFDLSHLNHQASLQAEVADLQWLGPILNPGLLLRGRLQAQAQLSGNWRQPRYQAQLQGRELQLAFAAEGLSLANGELDLNLAQDKLKVQKLQFSQAIQGAPAHARLRDWNGTGQTGTLRAQGEIDLNQERGSIRAEMRQFPLLQSKDRYLVVSGAAEISESRQVWELVGKLQADAAYFKLPKMPAPSLSSDVQVHRAKSDTSSKAKHVFKTRLDFSFDLGQRFVFVGRGLDTGLSGNLRLRGQDGAPLQASGSIRTEGGNYEAYGQKLEIARGILNFQDSPSNPALNVLALRRGQAVEAGVEISGTVAKPKVSLYSEPSVPDAEKLSWLVLGRGSEQLAAGDASLLMSAAGAIFGGEGQRNIPRQIVNGLGFDDFSIGASASQTSRLPSQTVAGSTGNHSGSNDQVLSLGKRLSPDLVLSVERGLADASGALKLSWQLSRRISINARTGNESALDVNYTFSFH